MSNLAKEMLRKLLDSGALDYEGPPVELIPKGRTKRDVVAYKFYRWWGRKHKKEIEAAIFNGLRGHVLRGYVGGSNEAME